jgi:YgiT-type zinc finger domain-containing protein
MTSAKKNHCDFCTGTTERKTVMREITRDGETYTFSVKAKVCNKCGERYYDGKTLLEMEKMVKKAALQPA